MVETIAAVQPTAMKGSQSGDPLTVNPYAVAGYADERYAFHRSRLFHNDFHTPNLHFLRGIGVVEVWHTGYNHP